MFLFQDDSLQKKLHEINDDIDGLYAQVRQQTADNHNNDDCIIKSFESIYKTILGLNKAYNYNDNKNLVLSLIDIFYKKLYYSLSFYPKLNTYVSVNKSKYDNLFQTSKKTLFLNDMFKLTKSLLVHKHHGKKDDSINADTSIENTSQSKYGAVWAIDHSQSGGFIHPAYTRNITGQVVQADLEIDRSPEYLLTEIYLFYIYWINSCYE